MTALLATEELQVGATAASGTLELAWLLLLLPLVGAAVALLGRRRTASFAHWLATGLCGAAFAWALVLLSALRGLAPGERSVTVHLFDFVNVGDLRVDAGLLLDPLSMTFVMLITGVGFLIHVYSTGYMEHDDRRWLFFGFLNLFIAAMLLLVLADNYLVLFVGWEGVGLASYLLISYYFTRSSAATAGKKAFIANRVGDVGLLLAMFLMFKTFGTLDFQGVFAGAEELTVGIALALALLLLLGACGKSGQFPLQTWLPDAMEGPTPVSALIHAATMVTAGVYLIARSNPIYDATQDGRTAVAIVGAVTLLIGCVIGCAYDDIKKVLAYSTVSQIGYMILAVGLGTAGYAVAILHLLTHGFFKACLFLSAGSVMHGMNDQVDIRRFGGLRTVMPATFACFGAGYLAIIGFPFTAGFYSKDAIIETAFNKGGTSGYVLGTIALVGAGITAFYMTRLMILTFFGPRRWTDDVHPHESPLSMLVPMGVLGGLSIVGGFLLEDVVHLEGWLAPVLGEAHEAGGTHTIDPLVLILFTLAIIAGGVAAAFLQYGRKPVPLTPPVAVTPLTTAARRNLYADAFNESVLMRPGQYLTRAFVFLDNRGIDGAVNGLAAAVGGTSGRVRRLQTGFARSYALSMFGGAVLLVGALLLGRAG